MARFRLRALRWRKEGGKCILVVSGMEIKISYVVLMIVGSAE